jgi:hypothetical protein
VHESLICRIFSEQLLNSKTASSPAYRLVIKSKLLLVRASGEPLIGAVSTTTSPLPINSLRIRLPGGIKAGIISCWRATGIGGSWPQP